MTPILRPAHPADLDRLAQLNRQLVEDEGHRNPMTVPQFRARFDRFLTVEGWTVEVIEAEGSIAGFATWRREPDPSQDSGHRIHLRQFFIARDRRGRGLGRAAMSQLLARVPAGDRVYIDVLESNPGGRAFWAALGFVPYALRMELTPGG